MSVATNRLTVEVELYSEGLIITEECYDDINDRSLCSDLEKGSSLAKAVKATINSHNHN